MLNVRFLLSLKNVENFLNEVGVYVLAMNKLDNDGYGCALNLHFKLR